MFAMMAAVSAALRRRRGARSSGAAKSMPRSCSATRSSSTSSEHVVAPAHSRPVRTTGELFSTSYGPTKSLAESLDDDRREELHQAWVDFFESNYRSDGEIDHDREWLLVLRDAPLSATVSLRDEVVELLQELIRLDTVNPPGNETRAAELLRDYLEDTASAASSTPRCRSGPTSSRGSPAAATGRASLLLSHTDTVLADPAEWQVDPWSGELRDGEIWGRGALDMKGQVAASAVAIASLAREGFRARRRPDLRGGGRRGGRRRLRAAVALQRAPGGGSRRVRAQRGRRRPARARRAAVLPAPRPPRR